MQTIVVVDQSEVETLCRDALRCAGFFAKADVPEHWPLTDNEAAQLFKVILPAGQPSDEVRAAFLKRNGATSWNATLLCALTGDWMQAAAQVAETMATEGRQ